MHVLQVVDASRLDVAIWILIPMVAVVMVFDSGNGAHKNTGLVVLDEAKHPMSSFLDLALLLWDLSLDLFAGIGFLLILIRLGAKGLFSSLFSSLNISIFFLSEGKGFINILQGLQVADLDV